MKAFVTGDKHGEYDDLAEFIECVSDWDDTVVSSERDLIIILGDSYLNYWLYKRDYQLKRSVSRTFEDFDLFIIRGNHDARPEYLPGIQTGRCLGSTVLVEPEFPNIKYAIDGNIYRYGDNNLLTIGGAFSIDGAARRSRGEPWFADEQPTESEKTIIEAAYYQNNVNTILSHTCPLSWMRKFKTELDLFSSEQYAIDTSTEEWLDTLCAADRFNTWYFGHFHGDMEIGTKGRMLMNQVVPLSAKSGSNQIVPEVD